MKTKPIISCFIPLLLLGSAFVVPAASAGTITLVVPSYDYTPTRATVTAGEGVANNGTVVGAFIFRGKYLSYTRTLQGRFGRPISFPGAKSTIAQGINNSGLICGSFDAVEGSRLPNHGFLYDGTTYTQYDLPGYDQTHLTGINDAGDFVGYGSLDTGGFTGFVSLGGVVTTFRGPGDTDIFPSGINNLGQIVGYYGGNFPQGFLRAADGTFTAPLVYPGATTTFPSGINDAGIIAGAYTDAAGRTFGFVLQNLSSYTSYDYPDTNDHITLFGGINNSNLISGSYSEGPLGGTHAFIARLGR